MSIIFDQNFLEQDKLKFNTDVEILKEAISIV